MGTGEKARPGCSNSKRRRVFKGRPGGGLVVETRRPIAEGDRFSELSSPELMAGDDVSCGSCWRA